MLLILTHKSPTVHAVFFWGEVDPEILHTCSTCPFRGLTRWGGGVFLFSPKEIGQGGYDKSYLTKNQAKKKTRRVRSSQGHTEDVCKIPRSGSKKRRGRSPANKFGVLT